MRLHFLIPITLTSDGHRCNASIILVKSHAKDIVVPTPTIDSQISTLSKFN